VGTGLSLANLYLLGQLPRLRRTATARLALHAGDSVLELACGTGADFPYVEAQIGSEGRLVGLDYTPSMLAQARNLMEKQGWQNVELVHADARLSTRWYVRPFNGLADLMGLGAAADISRKPWKVLPGYLTDVGYEELLMGFLYVAWGTKRTDG
jgi:SAM-dependent methyltransferase